MFKKVYGILSNSKQSDHIYTMTIRTTEAYAPIANHFNNSCILVYVKLEKRKAKENRNKGSLISKVVLEISKNESPAEKDDKIEKKQKTRRKTDVLFRCLSFVFHDTIPIRESIITGIGA